MFAGPTVPVTIPRRTRYWNSPAASRRVGPAPPAPDAELRRLRTRTVERDARNQRLFARLVRWLAWRPDSPDPRVLGGAAVIVAAIVSMVWRNGPAPSAPVRVSGGESAAIAAAAPPAPAPSPAGPTAANTLPPAPAGPSADAAPRPRATRPVAPVATGDAGPRGASARPGDDTRRPMESAATGVMPTPAPTAAAPIVIPAPPAPPAAGSALPADGRRAAATPAGPRGGRGRPTLYSANDADVAPPVMLRQQLPSSLLEPDSDVPEDWPYLELLIDEKGAVERVRLRARAPAPGQTLYRHRMLIAAAKAWQFEPALLNGQPVRYVMRVPLEP